MSKLIQSRLKRLIVLGILLLLFPGVKLLRREFYGTFLDLTIALLSFVGTLALASQFLFPIQGSRARWKALHCLASWYFGLNHPCFIVHDGHNEERIKGNRLSRLGTGVILVDSNSAVVLERGTSFSRVLGPGTAFTQRFEHIRGAIDLRPQIRQRRVHALTRDGIDIYVDLFIEFEIKRGKNSDPRMPYSFTDQAVFRAVYGESIGEKEKYDWGEAVATLAADQLRHIISCYTLDQLYAPDELDRNPRAEIQRTLNDMLPAIAIGKGVHFLDVTLGVFQAPKEIVQQRIKSWQADWVRRTLVIQARGEAEALRRRELARAQAQLEMILSITQGLKGITLPTPQGVELISLRFVEALEKMASEPLTRSLLPPETIQTLDTLLRSAKQER